MRTSWVEYFLGIAKRASEQSTCLRRHYGCVLVRDKTIISIGYNGSPRGCKHCSEIGCAREGLPSGEKPELCRATHAEQNAIANAARIGISTKDSELYLYPEDLICPLCAKIIINAGVTKVFYKSTGYPGANLSDAMLKESGVILVRLF